ncbi:MAG: rcc01693 family protein [Paracoccaceae bacterium]
MNGLDWPALMRAGLQGLRLDPATFWALTPAELRLMLGEHADQRPMLKAGLGALMDAWPDGKKGEPDERL